LAGGSGSQDNRYGASLNALAVAVQIQGRYDEAEGLFRRALAIWVRDPGRDRVDLAVGLSNLANLLRARGEFPEAERLYLEALTIERAAFGEESVTVVETLYGLGATQAAVGRYV
jgi:tetratricopeptide (TPR) repeat protein